MRTGHDIGVNDRGRSVRLVYTGCTLVYTGGTPAAAPVRRRSCGGEVGQESHLSSGDWRVPTHVAEDLSRRKAVAAVLS